MGNIRIHLCTVMILLVVAASACGNPMESEPTLRVDGDGLEKTVRSEGYGLQARLEPEAEGIAAYSFPEQAALLFQAVELTELENAKPAQTWEHAGTIPFGNVAGSPAFLQVFKETNPVASCGSDYQAVALLEHKGETFGYRECFSASLIEDAIQKKKASVVLLEKNHAAAGSNYVLQGAAALAANGPARMGYFYYDSSQDKWFAFEDWGNPRLADLDGDGADELVNQFEGLHLHWPDVNIYRWRGSVLEKSESVKAVLQVPHFSLSSAIANTESGPHTIKVQAAMDSEFVRTESATYK